MVGEVEPGSKGALVEQWILINFYFSTAIPLIQAHCAVRKIDYFSQNKLRCCREREKYEIKKFKDRATQKDSSTSVCGCASVFRQ